MAITIDFFLVNGASGRRFGNSIREEVVVGVAHGLSSTAGVTSANAMQAVNDALFALSPSRGPGSLHPNDAGMFCVEIVFGGRSADSIQFYQRYTNISGATPTSLAIDIDASLQAVERNKFPGGHEPIVTGWGGRQPNATGDDAVGTIQRAGAPIPLDFANYTYLRPMIRLRGTKVFYGSVKPEDVISVASCLGTTNEDDFLGRPPGTWLMSNYRTSQNRYGGTMAVSMEAIAKGAGESAGEDWRILSVIREPRTGRIAAPNQTKLNAALAADYEYLKIGGEDYDEKVDGFIVFGPYPFADFDKIWSAMGITSPDTPLFGLSGDEPLFTAPPLGGGA